MHQGVRLLPPAMPTNRLSRRYPSLPDSASFGDVYPVGTTTGSAGPPTPGRDPPTSMGAELESMGKLSKSLQRLEIPGHGIQPSAVANSIHVNRSWSGGGGGLAQYEMLPL